MTQYQLLPGVEGIKNAYALALQEKKLDVVCLSSEYEAIMGNFFDTDVAPKLYGKDIVLREIVASIPENKTLGDKSSTINERRFLRVSKPGQSDLMVGENMVVVISFNTIAPSALVMTDPELVGSFQTYFEVIWKSANV